MVISAYNRPGLVHRFVNATDALATVGEILDLRSLSQFDHFGRTLSAVAAVDDDQFNRVPWSAIKGGVPNPVPGRVPLRNRQRSR